MAKIVGDTTVTPMPVPDLAQTDERKADYIKNKKISFLENDIGYAEKAYVDNKVGEIDEALESFIDKTKVTMHFLDNNTLYTAKINTWMTWAEAIETEEVKALGMGFAIGDDGYVRCYLSAFIKEADYEGDVSASTFPTWCIKGTDKVKDGQVYTSSGVYEMDIPSGGTWKTLIDTTLTEEVNSVICVDSNSFPDIAKVGDFHMNIEIPKHETKQNGNMQIKLNNLYVFGCIGSFDTNYNYLVRWSGYSINIPNVNRFNLIPHQLMANTTSTSLNVITTCSILNVPLDKIHIDITSGGVLPIGTKIKIVGCVK